MANHSYSRALRRWSRMTDNNYHPQVVRESAKFFGYRDIERRMAELIDDNGKAGYNRNTDEESRLRNELFKRVRRDYGSDVADALNLGYRSSFPRNASIPNINASSANSRTQTVSYGGSVG